MAEMFPLRGGARALLAASSAKFVVWFERGGGPFTTGSTSSTESTASKRILWQAESSLKKDEGIRHSSHESFTKMYDINGIGFAEETGSYY